VVTSTFEHRPWPWRAGAIERGAARAADAKMAKNAPTVQSENAPKRVKMAKNDQKRCVTAIPVGENRVDCYGGL